jgi:Na+-transporting methylmalonyl-CoA/oxaloacetate decarboxylase gamma subunit
LTPQKQDSVVRILKNDRRQNPVVAAALSQKNKKQALPPA